MDLMNLFKLNIQYFAQDDTGGSNPSDDNADDTKDDQQGDQTDNKDKKDDQSKEGEPKFTQKQVNQMIQDRVKRLERDKQDAIDEAKKLAKMSADEKREYEFKKLQEENKQLKAEQNKFSLGKEATKILAESGIVASDEILDFVVREDAESTSAAVKAFSDLVDKVSEERMKEKLKGKSPKKQTRTPSAVTKESILAIKDGPERIKAIQDNPHLYK